MTAKSEGNHKKQEISNISVPKREAGVYEPESYNPVRGETALWKAVITQALMDAGSQSNKNEAQHDKAKAIRWLLGNSEDFVTVCLNADLDPQSVRKKAMAAIERGCIWRQGMAKKRLNNATAISPARPPLQRKSMLPICRSVDILPATPLSVPHIGHIMYSSVTTTNRSLSF